MDWIWSSSKGQRTTQLHLSDQVCLQNSFIRVIWHSIMQALVLMYHQTLSSHFDKSTVKSVATVVILAFNTLLGLLFKFRASNESQRRNGSFNVSKLTTQDPHLYRKRPHPLALMCGEPSFCGCYLAAWLGQCRSY